jgi:hypothetical protein
MTDDDMGGADHGDGEPQAQTDRFEATSDDSPLDVVRFRRRFRKRRDGTFAVTLPANERELLAMLPEQLRELMESDASDPVLRRLFPAAYHLDAEHEAEYQELTRDDLVSSRTQRAHLLASTSAATSLTEDELLAWMGAINDLRLVLGTQLDVGEDDAPIDPDDPSAPRHAVYHYLGFLLENVILALGGDVDD